VLVALVLGLVAGIGVHYARLAPRVALAGRLPAWACGTMAALATAGVAAALAAIAAPQVPIWPDLGHAAPAWPWLASAMAGLTVVPGAALTLFFLALLTRATADWTRRIGLVCGVLVLASAAPNVLAGTDVLQSLAKGAIEGASTFAFGWLLLRYDVRTVPAFVATGLVLEAVRVACLSPTVAVLTGLVVQVVVIVVVAAWATRYAGRLSPRTV